jgi:hypothetical protein
MSSVFTRSSLGGLSGEKGGDFGLWVSPASNGLIGAALVVVSRSLIAGLGVEATPATREPPLAYRETGEEQPCEFEAPSLRPFRLEH